MRKTFFYALIFLSAGLLPCRAVDLLISEFMSSNNRTIADENGDYSDWVEIFNSSSNTVNIGGWYLTDTASSPSKWQFPATNIQARGFLLVWCSGKNRRVPGAPLHTSFSLNAGGEYLALIRPDFTKASEFPASSQFNDISYGYVMQGNSTVLVGSTGPARALVPASDIGTSWRGTNYNDSTWLAGNLAAGFDRSTNYPSILGLNLGPVMSNLNASAYLRMPFSVTNPAIFKALTLRMRYDDGFVAYLNGTEVLRRNAPAALAWNSTATNYHGPPPAGALGENFEGTANYTLTQSGAAPAPAVQTSDAGSTGKFLRLMVDGTGNADNIVTFPQTAPGLFQKITSTFDFRMISAGGSPADGFAFMLIPTRSYGFTGAGITGVSAYEEPNFSGVFAIGFDVYPHSTQNDVSAHWNGTERLNVTMPKTSIDLVANSFHRAVVTLEHVTGGARVTVQFTPNINNSPGAAYTPIDGLFIPGLDPYDCRVEFAARSGGSTHGLDLDNVNVQFTPPQGVMAFESFDISAYLPLVSPGSNILAIQGLNLTASDSDFLIQPELSGVDFAIVGEPNYISPSTPGAWNNVVGAGTLDPVTFSPAPGVYTNSATIAIASSSSSAQIRYTLDNTEPAASSLLYTGPIVRASNTIVRARAYEAGKIDGPISSAAYTIIDSTLTNFTSNLPLIIIDTAGGSIVADNSIEAYAVMIDTNKNGARVSLNGAADFRGHVGIEYHGQSSLQFPKKSYNIEIHDDEANSINVGLLGLPKGSDWVLYAPYTDKSFINDVLTYDLHEASGHYAVRRKYVELFVRSSAGRLTYGDYMGIFVLLEKIRIDNNRVDISEPQSGQVNDPITGGYIWKRDKGGTTNDQFFTTIHQTSTDPLGEALRYHDPKYSKLTIVQRAWLTNFLNEFENVLYGNGWRDPVNGYAKYIDIGSFVDHHWAVEFAKNIDGYRLSNYLSKDRGGLIKEEPLWDWNLSFGNANYNEGAMTNNWYWPLLSEAQDMYFRRLRSDPDFSQRIIDRWGQLRTNVFALSNLLARVDEKTNLLNEAQARDFAKWPRLGTYVWPNPNGITNGTPPSGRQWDVDFQTPTNYAGIIAQTKKWITGRYLWVDNQFVRSPGLLLPSGLISPGATLAMTGGLGTIYYTLDGTDPRASNGVVSASARVYSGPITLTNNAGVYARALYTNSWSPPAHGVYVVTAPQLRISEIMYHPSDPPTNSVYDSDDFEYVELQNIGTNSINLSGAQLQGGIQFTFSSTVLAPGQYLAIAKNRLAFQSRYGVGPRVVGDYSGQLDNSGDHIVLLGPLGEPILDFSYNDGWYPLTDGLGFSLVPVDIQGSLNTWGSQEFWRASSSQSGSPGAFDPVVDISPVVVNEVLAHAVPPLVSSIELFNPSGSNANVGGWYLSDDFNTPKKYRIPDGTIIPAAGYAVFTSAQFNATPGATNNFGLDPEGDDAWIFSADSSGNLTGYAHGFTFGASDENVSFGRYIASDGDEDFPAQVSSTLGSANAGPIVGPIVISEVMYRPPDIAGLDNQADEYIELVNVSAAPVALYSPVVPTNTWHLRNGVDFNFPTNVLLAPSARLLVVSFDPATNATLTAAFRTKYGVPGAVALYGPYSGKLDNAGERIELHRPGSPTTNGFPYYMVEKVTYSDDLPWNPAADGYAPSLHRLNEIGYANDPSNWVAAVPGPGSAYIAGTQPQITLQPHGIATLAGASTNLSVSAVGPALRYQWRFNGANVVTATNATLNLPSIQMVQSGEYNVAVFNAAGAVLGTTVVVTVAQPLQITIQPTNQNVLPGTNVAMICAASGTGPIQYQWRFNGTNIPNATNAALLITNADLFVHSGNYQVALSDAISSNVTATAALVVWVKPYITAAPSTNVVVQGKTTMFSVTAGPIHPMLPLTYKWLILGSIGTVTNTSNSVLYIFNCQNSGTVRLSVTSTAGQTNITTGIAVNVLSDRDHDGIPDAWETAYGMNPDDAGDALADSDHDGMSNGDEFIAGTNPNDASSVLRVSVAPSNRSLLEFAAQSNISYTIQFRTNLGDSPWLNWSNIPALNPRQIQFVTETNDSRFYRIVTPRVQ